MIRSKSDDSVNPRPSAPSEAARTAKPSAETLRDRLLATFEMFELGVEMMAANLRRRHPDKVIGYSTHEAPENLAPVYVAIAKGAGMLERHVGVATDKYKLNAYSSTAGQVDLWIKAALKARALCGATERLPATEVEMSSLNSLKRGIFARKALRPGHEVHREDVYFAMPMSDGALYAPGDVLPVLGV